MSIDDHEDKIQQIDHKKQNHNGVDPNGRAAAEAESKIAMETDMEKVVHSSRKPEQENKE